MCLHALTFILCRLNLTPTPREKRTRTRTQTGGEPVPIPKKMRLETPHTQAKKSSVSSSAVGRIHITDVDPEGRYVEIKNMSDEVNFYVYIGLRT